MFIVTISNWRRKVIILACLILLLAAFSIGTNYSNNMNTVMVIEEMFDDPISASGQAIQVEGEATIEEGDTAVEDENQDQEIPDNGNLEEEFEEKEARKGFWQTILEKFRRE